jgi:hypothetical protein
MSAQLQLAMKPLGVRDPELDSSEDEEQVHPVQQVYVDPRAKDLELKRLQMEQRRAYGMDYFGDKEAGAGADPEVSSIASTVDPDDPEAPSVGDCERRWLHHGKSQAVVIAMAQGLVRVCEEPYQVLYVFEHGQG